MEDIIDDIAKERRTLWKYKIWNQREETRLVIVNRMPP
jgi:hypothetical protein